MEGSRNQYGDRKVVLNQYYLVEFTECYDLETVPLSEERSW